MSAKALRIAGIVALVGGTIATGGLLAGGVGLGAALGSSVALGVSVGQIVAFGALTTLGTLLGPRLPRASAAGLAAQLQLTVDPDAPRTVLLGRTTVAGVLRFRDVIAGGETTPDTLWLVIALGGYPIEAIEEIRINGTVVTPDPSTGAVSGGTFGGKLWIWSRLGTETTSAYPTLAAESASWASKTRIGRGVPSLAIKAIVDETFKGKLEPLITLRGAKLYDPRLDDTVGGSGPHRWGQPTTWSWSRNAALAKLTYLHGFTVDDVDLDPVLIAGLGLRTAPEQINIPNWIAEANICDEPILTLPAAGGITIPRYTVDGVLDPRRSHREQLQLLGTADAGAVIWSNGVYRNAAGVARLPAQTITEAEILGVPQAITFQRPARDQVSVVRGQFADGSQQSAVKDFPLRLDAIAFGRYGDRPLDLTLPYTADHRAAQRIAQLALRRSQAQRTMTILGSHRIMALQPGETVTLEAPTWGLPSLPMQVVSWEAQLLADERGQLGLVCLMSLQEDPASLYAWDPDVDEQPLTAPASLPPAEAHPSLKDLPQSDDARTGAGRAFNTIQVAGVLKPGTQQSDGAGVRGIVKGEQRGTVLDGGSVTFQIPYQSPPSGSLTGGLSVQPDAAAWPAGFSATAAQIDEYRMESLTPLGFTAIGRLRQASTTIFHGHGFAGTVLDVPGETDPVTLTSAPAWDHQYTVTADVSITLQPNPLDPQDVAGTLTYAIDVSADGGASWVERAIRTSAFATADPQGATQVERQVTTLTQAGLDGTDRIRLRFVSLELMGPIVVGSSGGNVVGLTGSTSTDTSGVWYRTSASDISTTKTPSADSPLDWVTRGTI